MRVSSISTFDSRIGLSPASLKRTADTKPTPETSLATSTATTPAPRAKAHGVIRKLGTGHYSAAVEAKLTARFAPDRLAPPATDPIADPTTDPVTDPTLEPQIIPSDETPTDPQPLPENELTTDVQLDITKPADEGLTTDLSSAFTNFNLLDITQPTRIDLIA